MSLSLILWRVYKCVTNLICTLDLMPFPFVNPGKADRRSIRGRKLDLFEQDEAARSAGEGGERSTLTEREELSLRGGRKAGTVDSDACVIIIGCSMTG